MIKSVVGGDSSEQGRHECLTIEGEILREGCDKSIEVMTYGAIAVMGRHGSSNGVREEEEEQQQPVPAVRLRHLLKHFGGRDKSS